jgi:hypothetical protein
VPVLEEVANALREDPTLGRLETQTRVAMIFWNAPDAAARCVALAADAERDAPKLDHARDAVGSQLARPDVSSEAPDLLGVVDALAARGSAAACTLAVTLLARAGERMGWSEAAAGRLRVLRGHRDHHVRAAALDVATAPE